MGTGQLLGWPARGSPVEWYPGWVTIEAAPHGQRLSFQASTAPPGAGTARVHVDVLVDDLAAAHRRVLAAARSLPPSTSHPARPGRRAHFLAGLPGPSRTPVLPRRPMSPRCRQVWQHKVPYIYGKDDRVPARGAEGAARPGRAVSGESEARIIRSALKGWLAGLLTRPTPHWGTIEFGDPDLPFKVDEVLAEGFGEQ